MQERIEFRIPQKHAERFLETNEGVRLSGGTRKYELDVTCSRFQSIGHFDRELKSEGRCFFTAWTVRRRYSQDELETSEVFNLTIRSVFEPAGEECGTKYDESTACSQCQSGAEQISDLFLPWNRIRKKDLSKTIAGEIVVSRSLVDLFEKHGIKGAEFRPVRSSPASSAVSKEWFQLFPKSCDAEITGPTKTGADPFDDDPENRFRCSRGDLIGLNLLSEIWIKRESYDGSDIFASKQFIGCRRGLLRPEHELFISPKLWRLISKEKLRGFKVEVAHLK